MKCNEIRENAIIPPSVSKPGFKYKAMYYFDSNTAE